MRKSARRGEVVLARGAVIQCADIIEFNLFYKVNSYFGKLTKLIYIDYVYSYFLINIYTFTLID